MTYLLKLRPDANVPAMTITITTASSQYESSRTWKAHLQYDDSSRQTTASFDTGPKTPMCEIFSTAFKALDDAWTRTL